MSVTLWCCPLTKVTQSTNKWRRAGVAVTDTRHPITRLYHQNFEAVILRSKSCIMLLYIQKFNISRYTNRSWFWTLFGWDRHWLWAFITVTFSITFQSSSRCSHSCPPWCGCDAAHLLWQRLLQGGQGSVCVTGVGLQGLDPVLQVPQLLVFVPQLLLQVLNLTQGGGGREAEVNNTTCCNSWTLEKSLKINAVYRQRHVRSLKCAEALQQSGFKRKLSDFRGEFEK